MRKINKVLLALTALSGGVVLSSCSLGGGEAEEIKFVESIEVEGKKTTCKKGDEFTLKGNVALAEGAPIGTSTEVGYKSSDETVAVVFADGKVVAIEDGTTEITVYSLKDETIFEKFTLKVGTGKKPVYTYVITFVKADSSATITGGVDGYTFKAEKASGQNNPTTYIEPELRLYAGNKLTISGEGMKKITFDANTCYVPEDQQHGKAVGTLVPNVGQINEFVWTGEATNEVVFEVPEKQVHINSITIDLR